MNIVPYQRQIRWIFRVALKRKLIRALYRSADAIGYCVALCRFHVIPACQTGWQRCFGAALGAAKTEPEFMPEATNPEKRRAPPVDLRDEMIRRSEKLNKEYNYFWAVGRLDELSSSGITDPVSYFNNEMTDWWLAPDGMMEAEADFVGIAVAIEERWYQ